METKIITEKETALRIIPTINVRCPLKFINNELVEISPGNRTKVRESIYSCAFGAKLLELVEPLECILEGFIDTYIDHHISYRGKEEILNEYTDFISINPSTITGCVNSFSIDTVNNKTKILYINFSKPTATSRGSVYGLALIKPTLQPIIAAWQDPSYGFDKESREYLNFFR